MNKFLINTNQNTPVMMYGLITPENGNLSNFSIDKRLVERKPPLCGLILAVLNSSASGSARLTILPREQHTSSAPGIGLKVFKNDRRSVIARLEWLDKTGSFRSDRLNTLLMLKNQDNGKK
jgi:hypothetical protein